MKFTSYTYANINCLMQGKTSAEDARTKTELAGEMLNRTERKRRTLAAYI